MGKQFDTKKLKSNHLPGVDLTVEAVHVDDDPHDPLVFAITVSDGEKSYTERHGYGSYAPSPGIQQNPVGPILSETDIQSKLDIYRQQTADRFAFMRAAAAAIPNLK